MARAQISFEYLIIVGISLLIIVPVLLFFLSFASGNEDTSSHTRVNEIGLQMVKTATNAYSLGKYSWLTLDVSLPSSVEGVYISSANELVIRYYTSYGLTSGVFYPSVTLTNATDNIATTGDVLNPVAVGREGIVQFRFTSQGANVSISVSDS